MGIALRATRSQSWAFALALPVGAALLALLILTIGLWALPVLAIATVCVVGLVRPLWAFYFLVLVLPLTSIGGMASNYHGVVQDFKKALVVGLIATWVLHVLIRRKPVLMPPRVLWPMLIFSAAAFASVARAIEPGLALTSTMRLISYCVAYVLVTINLLRTPEQIWTTIRILMVSGALTGAFAAYQLGAHFVGLPTLLNPSYEVFYAIPRVHSWMTEPLHLSNFLLFVAPLGLALYGWRMGRWPRLAFAAAAASVIGIVIAASRAGWGSFAVAISVFALLARGSLRPSRMLVLGAAVVLAVGVAGASVWSRGFGSVDELTSYLADFVTFRDQESGQGDLRGRLQNIALVTRAIETSPIIGIGTNNVGFRFYQYMTIGEPRISSSGNTYLDTFIETGAVGLAGFVALLIAGLASAWKGFRRLRDRPEGAACFGLFVGLFAMSLHINFYGSLTWAAHTFFGIGLCIAAGRVFLRHAAETCDFPIS